jgi:hypothetical protein
VGKKVCGIDQFLKEMYDMTIRDETMDNNVIMLNWNCFSKLRKFVKK